MPETINFANQQIKVQEFARQQESQCRLLKAEDGKLFLEYLKSTGPYKIDVPTIIELNTEQRELYLTGALDLSKLIPNN